MIHLKVCAVCGALESLCPRIAWSCYHVHSKVMPCCAGKPSLMCITLLQHTSCLYITYTNNKVFC